MSATQQPTAAPRPDTDPANAAATGDPPSLWRRKVGSALRSIGYIFAAVGLFATATGITLKDAVPLVLSLGEDDAQFAITSPRPNSSGPAVVKRCTDVRITVTESLPVDHELWVGTNRNGRKAVVERLDPVGGGTYSGQITIGTETDHNQKRQLVVLVVEPQASVWLQNVGDRLSLYDVPSQYWPPGTRVVKQMEVQRDSTSTLACR
ncbi:hypothetical protein [Streptomyces europaeiscabiei]|uniref:hypothetical protein n=1 Tax=Streptomyces europaeiscabiei TaxID=146819 RepID=UPI0038F6C1D9